MGQPGPRADEQRAGDALWCLAAAATALGTTLDDVAVKNSRSFSGVTQADTRQASRAASIDRYGSRLVS